LTIRFEGCKSTLLKPKRFFIHEQAGGGYMSRQGWKADVKASEARAATTKRKG